MKKDLFKTENVLKVIGWVFVAVAFFYGNVERLARVEEGISYLRSDNDLLRKDIADLRMFIFKQAENKRVLKNYN
jgi:hypothetical protein